LIKQHLFKPISEQRRVPPSATPRVPSPPDTVLVNFDATIFEASGCMGTGVIITDHRGNFLAACQHYFEGIASPEYDESFALRRAVEVAREKGMDKVIFESNCLSLVQRLNSTIMDRSSVGLIVASIMVQLGGFISASFRHVKRVFNEAVHYLAKLCEGVNSSSIFLSVPDCIRETFYIDVI
jgi:hypothetical protein